MTRRAQLESTFDDDATARQVAAAIEPDNTPEIRTRVHGTTVVTEVERETTGGLQATLDDYVVNLQIAAQLTAQDGDSSTTTTDNHE